MRIVYAVSSLGLGHARRSLVLARNLRDLNSDVEISWISAEPVISFLESEGEKILPVSRELRSLSTVMEDQVISGRLSDMSRVARNSSSIARTNYSLLKNHLASFEFLIQDEFAETMFCFMWDKNPKLPAFRVVITDYLQFESGHTLNPLSRVITWYANRMLARAFSNASLRIFADDSKAVPLRHRARLDDFEVVGPILPKLPIASKSDLKYKIISSEFEDAPDDRKLILVSVGGTSTGKVLIDFLFANFREISRELNCRIIALLGPRIGKLEYKVSKEDPIRFVTFTASNIQYFKAADCAVCQAGASTLNEVASLGMPCVAIPISNHFEQEANAKRFSDEYGFSVLRYEELTVKSLVDAVDNASGKSYSRPDFSEDAISAARLILKGSGI
jgi:UDP-N-acetylglucosamine--N-acetylmuramyl-(pentapeptide) pyrophosphoryl-undecaprenol N-acetylglucosamine transferase